MTEKRKSREAGKREGGKVKVRGKSEKLGNRIEGGARYP
jgi:hypothetical protein